MKLIIILIKYSFILFTQETLKHTCNLCKSTFPDIISFSKEETFLIHFIFYRKFYYKKFIDQD